MKDLSHSGQIPKWQWLGVLFLFPFISTLLSLLLLDKDLLSTEINGFYSVFWIIITCWYGLQLFLIGQILKSAGLSWSAIGYTYNRRQSMYLIGSYLIIGIGLIFFIEFALSAAQIDQSKLNGMSDLSDITPKNTLNRAIFLVMGLMAGLTEEIIYRGFAIKILEKNGVNKWLGMIIASIPFVFQHGLKSLDQFWWFLTWGIILGIIFNLRKRLDLSIIIHWLVILAGLMAVLQVLE